MKKAYSTISFHTKGMDEDQRVIKGVASTPSPDRSNDIVDPLGAQFKLPIPLLSQHDHTKPIGEVIEAKVTKAGIEFTAKIAKGIGYVDEAWAQIKQGLIRGVSIGFRPLEYEEFKNADGYGTNFKRWEWYELSAVTVPANSQATISVIKKLATFGTNDLTKTATPNALGKTVSLINPKKVNMKSISEQITAFKQKHADLAAASSAILAKSADESRTLDENESEMYDANVAEMAAVTKHVERLQAAEKHAIATATPVDGTTQKSAVDSRAGVITVRDNLAPGQAFARYVKCLAQARGNIMLAENIAKSQYPENHQLHTVMKAAVASGTTTDATWAAPLTDYTNFAGDFVSYLRPSTILGKFGANGVPSLRNIPFMVKIKGQTSGGEGYWVGESAGKPLTKMDFTDVEHRFAKVANIAVITDELARWSSPSAELLIRDTLRDALVARLDQDFVNPAKAAVANVSPASITNTATATVATGTDEDALRTDAKTLMSAFVTANLDLADGVWILQSSQALAISMMQNALGQQSHPGMSMRGGTLFGLPCITSQHVPTGVIVLVAASEIYMSDDGQIMIDSSREATLEMSDSPSGTATRSMFQMNEVAIRAEKYVNWSKRRTTAVRYISGAAYTG